MPYAFHLRLGGVRWPVFVYCVMGTWVRYRSHMRIRYGTEPVLLYFFYYLLLWYVTYTLIVTSLVVLIIILILIIHIISIKCVYVRVYYEYSLTAIKSLL